MSEANPEPKLYSEEIDQWFFHIDNLLHNRINMHFAAQSILLLSAVETLDKPVLCRFICFGGIVITFIFTFTCLKLFWRLSGLNKKKLDTNPEYKSYLSLAWKEKSKNSFVFFLQKRFVCNKPTSWSESGNLHTWVLSGCLIILWGVLFWQSFNKVNS